MGEQSTEDIWTIVMSGGRYYIGKIVKSNVEADPDYVSRWPNEGVAVIMAPCFEVTMQLIPLNGPSGPTLHRVINAEPVMLCFDESPVTLGITGVIEWHTMSQGDRNRYKALVRDAMKLATEARAQDSGITLSTKGLRPGA